MTDFLIKTFIKSQDTEDPLIREKYGYLGAFVGIIVNLSLFAMKLTVGLLMRSISVTADAFNNLSDTASSVITLLGFKLGNMPADEGHPYGHGRLEYFSGLIVSVLVLYVGFQFLFSSLRRILHPEPLSFQWIPIVLLTASILAKVWMASFNHQLGKRIHSTALKATALDARGDVMISSTVVVGLLISHWMNWQIDGFIGLFVAVMILKSAFELIQETINPLIGDKQDPELVRAIEQTMLESDEIYGVHDTVTHNYGPNTVMATIHVEVRDDISILSIHDIVDDLEKKVKRSLGVDLVSHLDPIHIKDPQQAALIRSMTKKLMAVEGIVSLHDVRLREEGTRFIAEVVLLPKSDAQELQKTVESIILAHGLTPEISVEKEKILVQHRR